MVKFTNQIENLMTFLRKIKKETQNQNELPGLIQIPYKQAGRSS
jgi:hypothetical protein